MVLSAGTGIRQHVEFYRKVKSNGVYQIRQLEPVQGRFAAVSINPESTTGDYLYLRVAPMPAYDFISLSWYSPQTFKTLEQSDLVIITFYLSTLLFVMFFSLSQAILTKHPLFLSYTFFLLGLALVNGLFEGLMTRSLGDVDERLIYYLLFTIALSGAFFYLMILKDFVSFLVPNSGLWIFRKKVWQTLFITSLAMLVLFGSQLQYQMALTFIQLYMLVNFLIVVVFLYRTGHIKDRVVIVLVLTNALFHLGFVIEILINDVRLGPLLAIAKPELFQWLRQYGFYSFSYAELLGLAIAISMAFQQAYRDKLEAVALAEEIRSRYASKLEADLKNRVVNQLSDETMNSRKPGADFETMTLNQRSSDNRASAVQQPETPFEHPFMNKVHSILTHQLSDKALTVDVLAQSLHMTDSTFRRRCNEYFGKTPIQLIRLYRMRRAHDLIESGQVRTLSEAADSVGFTNVSYFSKQYRRFLNEDER
ncbi:two-component system sensor histidine kinase/response regulator, hybrid ('one-component system') [Reinekea sp. MED297]|uniref:Two-component system sensor histidine kinase/response regulator, hybrid ('one-component system') n=2 Tax=Reinekea TaxID=230494 RepID=A4BK23_9GAMM|nr:two-component system sensor histidine kinase/response regulator, hybrid ('one-component system') [Reinekea sp. MED297] [Reinekea blandensis MED297]